MFIILILMVGLCLGSFVNALVWRLREQAEREEGHAAKGKLTGKDLSIAHGRSMCPNCYHELAPKDLIPVISWATLRGKCRYCNKPISIQYPFVELLTAVLFVFSYIFWPNSFQGVGLFTFLLWLVFLTGFVALTVYDLRWFMLPNRIVYPLIVLAFLQLVIVSIFYDGGINALLGGLWGVLIASGIFYVLFQISNGKWIGGGDVKLGIVIGLLLGGPLMSWLMLFFASCAGTIISLPLVAAHKAKHDTHLPFGPFLIFGAIIVQLFGTGIISWARQHYLL